MAKHSHEATLEPEVKQNTPPMHGAAPPKAPPAPAPTAAPNPTAAPDPAATVSPAAFTLPPILLRSSYPPSQPGIGAPPKLLKATPTGSGQIMYPGSLLGTLTQGPLLSGTTPGVNGAVGAARLTLALQVDYTMKNFQVPILFPGDSFLLAINSVTITPGLPAVITLGTQAGQGDVCAVTPPAENATAPPQLPGVQIPLWDAVAPMVPFTIWLNVSGNTAGTAGLVIVLIDYVRVASPWSAPSH